MPTTIERQSVAPPSDAATASELSKAFLAPLGSRSYSKQYAQLYDYRLAYLKKRILPRAKSRWIDNFDAFSQSQSQPLSQLDSSDAGPSSADARVRMQDPPKFVDRILDVRQGDICYVVGNVYCAMPLKPDVLEDLTREQWLAPQPVRSKFVDYAKDELFIEDQSGRVKLVGDAIRGGTALRSMLITGVVAAVLGTETRASDFDVVDAVFASLPPAPSKPLTKAENGTSAKHESSAKDQWVVLMSGLAIGGDSALESELSMQLLVEYLTGELGEDADRVSSSNIVAAVIAGNSLAPPTRNEDQDKPKRYGQDQPTYSSAPTLALDQLLADLCSSMPVHLLPGERDPASVAVPQQPIHFALLPRAGRFDSLQRHTNPAWMQLGERTLLGTSGQNIDDIFKYVDEPDDARIEMAMRTLEWGHVAPTAPDTLWCYPFKASDPFVLKHRPDILVVGNQPKYASAVYGFDKEDGEGKGCRVVLVPEFAKTKQVVLVNLASLETRLVCIETPL
ncbi:related to HYS2-DNA-directed DNA polymerase delta, 55 KD subunit [Sporisorium reilianum f. sp. reilianum]|uniref:Related to HYS2-DNA-directed DNA polymerase delta, 55 KD subunit n=1 Tax=Sporisorium reilianum f. sp. reilianum TaxID=72559 RepID=A0A2N8UJL4_9BASI|nr:related to HYS2-DNA-directed DNA polymerase delta, 55 KD subunit [Sporisorium reilianum f. sp. reilianum]